MGKVSSVSQKRRTDVKAPAKRRRGYHRAVTPEVAAEICRRIASGRTLLAVCRDADMPHHDALYDEIARSPLFRDAIARARAESAHGLAMSAVEIADEAVANPQDKPHWAQLVKNQCDQRRWLAGKYSATYSDKVAVTDSDGGSIVERLARMSAEQRLAWATDVAATARRLLEAPTIDHDDS